MALVKRRMSNLNLNLNNDRDEEKTSPSDKFLVANAPQCVNNLKKLELLHWILHQQDHKPTNLNCIKHIKRVSGDKKAKLKRKRPQWITSYYAKDKTLLIWIMGTDNQWDWTNLLNVCHKPIELRKPSAHTIKVHHGVYNAINNVLFYAPLFADIHIHFSDPNQPINKIIFAGHSQGGAIATLMFLLWKGRVQCEFVDYFNEQMMSTNVELDKITEVYTFGGVTVVSHNSSIYVDNIFGSLITNVINPNDVIPRMYGGNRNEPKKPLKASKKIGFARVAINKYGKALMDNFTKVASFGPIGEFILFFDNELRVLHRKDDKHGLFNDHLVHGAHNYSLTNLKKDWSDAPTLLLLHKHHRFITYKQQLGHILKIYINNLLNKKQ